MKIEVKNITKKYKQTIALDNISFTLEQPKIYGLLGRNGAGKTTFMQLLAGHQLPTSGSIFVNNENPYDQRKITEQICLIRENDNFHRDLKINQVLRIYKNFYPNWDDELANTLMKKYSLSVNKRIKVLSKGMVSALGVIVGLASNAPITIFDEPYIGLDASSRQLFYDTLLMEYEKEPRTFILSTHLIDEASKLFEEVILLRNGKLILHENVDTLRSRAYSVTGETNEIDKYIADKHVLNIKHIGHLKTAYIYGEEMNQAVERLSFENLSIQELMIYLSEHNGGEKYESAI